ELQRGLVTQQRPVPAPFLLLHSREGVSCARMSLVKSGGRFQLTRLIGEGGFGTVYEAFDRDRNSVVALKRLHRFDAVALFRFKREFRTLADINHPHVVTLYELVAEQDDWLLTMELVNGVPFVDYVRDASRTAALDVNRLRLVFGQVADALSAIHQIGI